MGLFDFFKKKPTLKKTLRDPSKKGLILVSDCNISARQQMLEILERHGYQVVLANSLVSAAELYVLDRPDLTIMGFINSYRLKISSRERNDLSAEKANLRLLEPELASLGWTRADFEKALGILHNGLAALTLIHGLDSSAKMIVTSPMGQEAIVMDAIKQGARDFLVQPIAEERLMRSVNALVP